LTSIAGLTTAANKMIYTSGSDTYAVADLSVFARTILDDADAGAVRTTIGAQASGSYQTSDAGLTSIAGLTTAANKMIYTSGSDTYVAADLSVFARTILDDADAGAVRTTIGAQASGSYQTSDAGLTSIAGLTTAANKMIYTSGSDTYAVADLSVFARTILDDANAGAVRTTIGAEASDAGLTSIAGLTTAADKMIYTSGSDTYVVTGLSAFARTILDDADAAAVRATIGAGSSVAQAFTELSDVGDTTKTAGRLMVADGDSWESVVVSGDATLAADGAVSIVDNAVGIAELAGIARGKIIVGDSSNNPALLAAGSDGDVLQIDGSGDAVWAAAGAADITSVVAGAGMTGGATSGDATLNVIGGNGITANADDVAITAAQTTITSVYNAGLKMGRDAHNLVDFATADDKIIFRVGDVNEIEVVPNVLQPTTSNGAALGTSSLMWSDLFLASGAVINFAGGGLTLTHASSFGSDTVTLAGGTLDAAAIKLGGTALGSLYSPIAGSSSIVTTGTIGTGTWQGTAVDLAYGGTGLVGATDGKIVIADGNGAPVLLDVGSSTAITTLGTVTAGAWESSTVVASAYLDADTAHLTGTQTFSGAKTLSAPILSMHIGATTQIIVDDAPTTWSLGWWESSDGRWWLLGNTAGAASFSRANAEFYIPTGNITDVPAS
jgi:hypothetical protein